VSDIGLEFGQEKTQNRYIYRFFKRATDVFLSLLGLILLSPVFLITAICIKFDSPGPVIFRQDRAGKNGIPFVVYKFRSMYQDAEERLMKSKSLEKRNDTPFIEKRKNDPRITKLGWFLRVTTIDELPQLVDVLRGKMSIVGPRPLAMYEYDAMSIYEQQRTLVKPGLTCIWQVNGRNNVKGKERVEMDLQYVREHRFLLDIVLILKTFPALITQRGAF